MRMRSLKELIRKNGPNLEIPALPPPPKKNTILNKYLLDQSVVTVTSTYTLGPRNVLDGHLLVLEAEGQLGHLVHGHHLVGSDVEGLVVVGPHQAEDS